MGVIKITFDLYNVTLCSTPEDFIRNSTLSKGNHSTLTKDKMFDLIIERNIPCNIARSNLRSVRKSKLFNMLLTSYSYKELSKYVGVSMRCFLEKFNINESDFKELVKVNVFNRTLCSTLMFINNGIKSYRTIYGYDVYDYYYTPKDIVDYYLNLIKSKHT